VVEHFLGKEEVAGPIPINGSKILTGNVEENRPLSIFWFLKEKIHNSKYFGLTFDKQSFI
jgi:hypothetical protein